MTGKHGSARVAVVGGGLAGLAAAERLTEQGVAVELFESRRRLGGRAGSFVEPGTDRMTDYGQHVSMGCCTALAELLGRTGLGDTFETHGRLNFLGPDGRPRTLAAGWLPSPLHLLPGLLRFDYLSLAERWRIVRAMWAMRRLAPGATAGLPSGVRGTQGLIGDEPVDAWLRRHGQSQRAIDRFWSPVLISALSETLDRASLRMSRTVIVEGLLASRRSYELRIPRLPLAEIFDRRLGRWLEPRGVEIHRLTRVARIEGDSRCAKSLVFEKRGATGVLPSSVPGGWGIAERCPSNALHGQDARGTQVVEFDAIVLAVPWDRVGRVLSPELLAAVPGLNRLDEIGPAAITTVHLGYDRPITDLTHAAIVGRLGQWVFAQPGNRYQVVISASHRLVDVARETLCDRIERELSQVFPAAASARVVHRRVVVQPRAVFSAYPGIDPLRPAQQTPIENLALAGDWTATGWPATMEGAVRSGRAAADAILQTLDRAGRRTTLEETNP